MTGMKKILYTGFYTVLLSMIIASCEKVEPLKIYLPGSASVLTSNVNTLAPVVGDSSKTALTFNWTNPGYSVDSTTVKYVIEIDSAGRNFTKAVQKTVSGKFTLSYISKELNDIALSFGCAFNKQASLEARLVSSHANNNERLASNVIALKYTPYVTPPKVTPPSSNQLFLVGSATAGGWNNPVPVPSQQFTRLDSVTYEGTFYMKGGEQYLCLPVNGNWSTKYSVANNTVAGLNKGGVFGFNLSDNFPGPDKTGTYKIRLDFQSGYFTVTLVQEYGLLYVAGDYQGWNPAAAPQLASPKKDGVYEGYVYVPAGGTYQFKLTSENSWNGTNYGDGGVGKISTTGGNLSFPGAGFFKINVNTTNNTWSILQTSWTIIGSLTGWGSDITMNYNTGNKSWEATVTVAQAEEFKFRANNDWPINLGDDNADNSLEYNGANIKLTAAGTYNISLTMSNAGYYTYKVVKQ